MDVLPQCVVLKLQDHNKYLSRRPSKEHEASKSSSRLCFSDQKSEGEKADEQHSAINGDKKVSETSEKIEPHLFRFEFEKAKTSQGLVHVKTCYNNKYWVRKSEDSNLVVAEAHEPEEDQSKWSCTLFKPLLLDAEADADADTDESADTKKMRLLHVGELNHDYVGINNNSDDDDEFHLTKVANLTDATIFTVINADSIAILPEYVAFMGQNGKYLTACPPGHSYIASTANEVTELGVPHTISVKNQQQGSITVFNRAIEQYWGLQNIFEYYIVCCVKLNHASWPFQVEPIELIPIKVGNEIALKFAQRNIFCNVKNLSGLIKLDNALCMGTSTISKDARLKVAEPIFAREILDATFRLNDARVYNKSVVDKFVDSRSNNTGVEQTGSFQVSYKESQTMTWKQSTTVNIGVKASWSAGIPYVGELGVEVSYEHSQTMEYGEEQTNETSVSYSQNISIPAGKKVTLKVVASKAYCDVPFTCKVRDTMFDGTVREYTKTDGLYVGCNEFGFNTVMSEDHL